MHSLYYLRKGLIFYIQRDKEFMKKIILNRILIGIIVCLSISICILIICITNRPHYINTEELETAVITEVPISESLIDNDSETSDKTADKTEASEAIATEESVQKKYGKTSTEVNIRDADNNQAKVLATVDAGTKFEIIEIQNNGWIKIIYDGAEAYISSSYVILINE